MSEPRLFTPEEVDRLIPRLTELMETAIERHGQAAGGDRGDASDWKARAERLDGLGIEVRQVIEAIQAMGGVIKDLETGLVDFPGRGPGEHRAQVVNLCWRHGEAAVEFWHGMDEGFAQRKPLS